MIYSRNLDGEDRHVFTTEILAGEYKSDTGFPKPYSTVAYYGGFLYYEIISHPTYGSTLARVNSEGDMYVYQGFSRCISHDGLLTWVDEDDDCLKIENPLDSSIETVDLTALGPDVLSSSCVAWLDEGTLILDVLYEHGDTATDVLKCYSPRDRSVADMPASDHSPLTISGRMPTYAYFCLDPTNTLASPAAFLTTSTS